MIATRNPYSIPLRSISGTKFVEGRVPTIPDTEASVTAPPAGKGVMKMDKNFYCCGSASADWCIINCVPKSCYIDLKTKDQAPVYILIGGPLAGETRRINNDFEHK
jgi:hypothetical protein